MMIAAAATETERKIDKNRRQKLVLEIGANIWVLDCSLAFWC